MQRNYETSETLPPIVQEKCQAAYTQIRQEAAEAASKKHPRKKLLVFTAVLSAAAVGIGVAVPVAASSGAFHSIYSFFSGKAVYSDDPYQQNDLSAYAQPVEQQTSAENGSLQLDEVYFDGENLSMTLRLTDLPADMQESTTLQAPIEATLNGEALEFHAITGIYPVDPETSMVSMNGSDCVEQTLNYAGFLKSENGFVTVLTASYDGTVSGTASLRISVPYYQGVDSSVMLLQQENADGSRSYAPKETASHTLDASLTTEIQRQTDLETVYTPNETSQGITLEQVIVSPFSTEIVLSGSISENAVIEVTDQNQTAYAFLEDGVFDLHDSTWETPLTDATSLTITIAPDKESTAEAVTFTVPIEKGYRTASENDFNAAGGNDVTYIPPLE